MIKEAYDYGVRAAFEKLGVSPEFLNKLRRSFVTNHVPEHLQSMANPTLQSLEHAPAWRSSLGTSRHNNLRDLADLPARPHTDYSPDSSFWHQHEQAAGGGGGGSFLDSVKRKIEEFLHSEQGQAFGSRANTLARNLKQKASEFGDQIKENPLGAATAAASGIAGLHGAVKAVKGVHGHFTGGAAQATQQAAKAAPEAAGNMFGRARQWVGENKLPAIGIPAALGAGAVGKHVYDEHQ